MLVIGITRMGPCSAPFNNLCIVLPPGFIDDLHWPFPRPWPPGVLRGKGYARGPLPDRSHPINQGLRSSVVVSQMAAVVGGAQQESRPVILPVANRPDFVWLSASSEWLREAHRGPVAHDLCFFSQGAKPQRAFSPHQPWGLASHSISEEVSQSGKAECNRTPSGKEMVVSTPLPWAYRPLASPFPLEQHLKLCGPLRTVLFS